MQAREGGKGGRAGVRAGGMEEGKVSVKQGDLQSRISQLQICATLLQCKACLLCLGTQFLNGLLEALSCIEIQYQVVILFDNLRVDSSTKTSAYTWLRNVQQHVEEKQIRH